MDAMPQSLKELYRKLQIHLDRMPVGFPATKSGIELKLLRYLFTPQQAEAALHLSAVPEPVKRIQGRAGKSGLSAFDFREILEEMAADGLIFKTVDSRGCPLYSKLPLAIGIYEMQVFRLTRELEELFLQYVKEAFGDAFLSRKTTQMRTIPVDIRLTADRNVVTYDDARGLVERAKGPFAVIDCICKKGQALRGKPCGQRDYREACLTLGSMAEKVLRSGRGKRLERREVGLLLDRADEEGLVVQPQNTRDPGFICFCCGCCCHVLRTAKRYPEPASFFSTNYFARVDPDLCIACGSCSSRCQMEAIFTDETQTLVDLTRCIGCGLCVTACPSEAIRLEKSPKTRIPPKDQNELYLRILKERFGPTGTAKIAVKKVLGMKI